MRGKKGSLIAYRSSEIFKFVARGGPWRCESYGSRKNQARLRYLKSSRFLMYGDPLLEKLLKAGWTMPDALSIMREGGVFDRSVELPCHGCGALIATTRREILDRDPFACGCGRVFTTIELSIIWPGSLEDVRNRGSEDPPQCGG